MEDECCPQFDPAPWDEKTFVWKDKRFVKARVLTLFFIPVNFAGVIRNLNTLIEKAGAAMPDFLCLSDHTSWWNMDIYLAVDKEVPGAENTTMSGTFLTKVYEGPFSDTGKWCSDFDEYAQKKGKKTGKKYMWYTTCPKCAKKYGKNYVVEVAEIL